MYRHRRATRQVDDIVGDDGLVVNSIAIGRKRSRGNLEEVDAVVGDPGGDRQVVALGDGVRVHVSRDERLRQVLRSLGVEDPADEDGIVVQRDALEYDAQQPVVTGDPREADSDADDVAVVFFGVLLVPRHVGPVDLDRSDDLHRCLRLDVELVEAAAVVAAHPVGQLGRLPDHGVLGPHLPHHGIGQRWRDLYGNRIDRRGRKDVAALEQNAKLPVLAGCR